VRCLVSLVRSDRQTARTQLRENSELRLPKGQPALFLLIDDGSGGGGGGALEARTRFFELVLSTLRTG
jgi:hypothetical protein